MPLQISGLDDLTVRRFCAILDERDEVLTAMKRHGPLLAEPIVTPTGAVVGERLVANPAAAMLRALDRALDSLSDRLGVTPAARARLGLTMTSAERQALEVDRLLSGKWRDQ